MYEVQYSTWKEIELVQKQSTPQTPNKTSGNAQHETSNRIKARNHAEKIPETAGAQR